MNNEILEYFENNKDVYKNLKIEHLFNLILNQKEDAKILNYKYRKFKNFDEILKFDK